MGDVVDLQGQPVHLEDNQEFVADCCRFFENLLSEEAMKRKYKFSDDVWERLGSDEKLIEAVEAEKIRRMRDGSSKREKAQKLVLKAPETLSGIMLDANASPRHRIDSAKALDDFAANGPQGVPAADRFTIIINMGDDHIERYNKSITIDPNDIDPNEAGTALEETAFVAIAAKKSQDNDNGGHL